MLLKYVFVKRVVYNIRLALNIYAIYASSISLVAQFAVILFKDELTPRKTNGILGVTIGLILLLI